MNDDWTARLRARGFRITPQRQLVLEAVESLGHGTPEEILAEVQQTASGVKSDTQAYSGTGKPYQATGWKAGDKNSWEQQLKTRTVTYKVGRMAQCCLIFWV